MTPPVKQAVRNASDPLQVAEARKHDALRKQNEDNDLIDLMNTEVGRRVIWRFLNYTNVYESIFTTSSEIYYRAGKQDVGHRVMKEVARVTPAAYLLMQQEAGKLDESLVSPEPTKDAQ